RAGRLERRVHAQEIARGAEARDLSPRRGRDHRMAPELLPGVDIREVDLDDGHGDGGDRVAERERVVGQRAGVDDDGPETFLRGALDPVDELAFVVRLAADRFGAPARRLALALTRRPGEG